MNEQLVGLTAAMEILPDAVLIVNREQVIIGCNRVAEELFGYRHDEMVSQPLGILIPAAMRAAHEKLLANYSPAKGYRPMQSGSVFYGVSKSGLKLPLSIGISTCGSGQDTMFIAIIRDASSIDKTLEGAAIAAETDQLTKLGNRRCLTSIFHELARESRLSVGLLFLDLNDFKPLNDQYGHDAGDEVLRIVARRISASLRSSDRCIRLGGDEFVVVLPGIKRPEILRRIALKLYKRICARLRLGAVTAHVGVSIGGAIGRPSDGDGESILARADAAMYEAKRHDEPYVYDDPSLDAVA